MTPSGRGTPPPSVQHPQALHELATGLALARGGPGRTLNVYLLGTVVLDSGVRWSRRRLARQLAGRQVTAHVLTHAHFDHAGSSAWLCRTLGVPLWCGAGDAAAIDSGRVDSHGAAWCNRLQRTLAPVTAHPVSRSLGEGDLVAGFEVLEVPGHSPGALAFWRERDRVLVCGDVLANLGLHPSRPRLVLAPAALSSDAESAFGRSAGRAAAPAGLLWPRLRIDGPGAVGRRRGPDLQALEPGRPVALQHALDADLVARWRLGWRGTAWWPAHRLAAFGPAVPPDGLGRGQPGARLLRWITVLAVI